MRYFNRVPIYNDLIFIRNKPKMVDDFKKVITEEFEMTDIRLMVYYLSIEVKQQENGIFISQEGYTKEILKKFKVNNCKPINTLVKCRIKLSNHEK